jgi:CubicO group peptidase (beta-lactamase class C family)
VLSRDPARAPGTAIEYSNAGFVLAGAMLERIAGAPWEELVEREVFAPLGIASGGFGPPGSADALDQPRGHRGGTALAPGPLADNPPAYGPAGRAHMDVADWARFVAAHLQGARASAAAGEAVPAEGARSGDAGDGAFLSPGSFAKLHAAPAGQAYAMGWVREPRAWAGGDVLWHNGSNALWYCVAWIAPEKDRAFLALTNVGGEAGAKACDAAVVAMVRREGLAE